MVSFGNKRGHALLAVALALAGCDGNRCECNPATATPAQPPSAPPTTAPAAQPSASPVPAPLSRTESVAFPAGALAARGKPFEVDVLRPVVVTVGCHQSWVPQQLVKVDLLTEVGQRVVSRRCRGGASPPACMDIGFDVELEPGRYVIELERWERFRQWEDYWCNVTVAGM